MVAAQFHSMPEGRAIAFRHFAGRGPAVVFLPGYMSDMSGSKASAIAAWAQAHGQECLLLDYSGCGESPGDFAEGTLGRWLEEAVSLIEARIRGDAVLVGSSMGGWLMLLAAPVLDARVTGLIGIAAAPDFTAWGYADAEKRRLEGGETVLRNNPYGPEPMPTHAAFWRDGQAHRVLGGTIAFDGPVKLLHGLEDEEVPHELALRIAGAVRSQDVQITLVKGGDHRLSRDGDIALLLRALASLCDRNP